MVLVHHRGRKSGGRYVTPMKYLPDGAEPDIIYVFATKAGAPTHPDWYRNLIAAKNATVERGTETYKVTVRELAGRRTRPRLRRESAALPRLCRVRTPDCRNPHHSRARTQASVAH
jgi:deazaflavin-dependent oxidoreductase (nitroreductase family)